MPTPLPIGSGPIGSMCARGAGWAEERVVGAWNCWPTEKLVNQLNSLTHSLTHSLTSSPTRCAWFPLTGCPTDDERLELLGRFISPQEADSRGVSGRVFGAKADTLEVCRCLIREKRRDRSGYRATTERRTQNRTDQWLHGVPLPPNISLRAPSL